MRLLPSDPDVETIISRIEADDLNLQPDFQRGEVWSRVKKQRLVDSILRDWHVPPIHVIELTSTRRQEVLDGQQRLVAIRDFYRNEFPVDGSIEPMDPLIVKLGGLKYRDLPDDARRQFNQFTIRVFRIVDYKSSEPAELFFRLNQPTNLTSAEQRNAFFGPVREQIKGLVDSLGQFGLDKSFLGFSNSRMAYDDVLSRVALSVERGTIGEKIAAADLVELYRTDSFFSQRTEAKVRSALRLLGQAGQERKQHPRFNKATMYSWLIFLIRANSHQFEHQIDSAMLANLLKFFEDQRFSASLGFGPDMSQMIGGLSTEWIFQVYEDRSTSRVADVSSVILRDMAIWFIFSYYLFKTKEGLTDVPLPEPLRRVADGQNSPEADVLARTALREGWGDLE
jgi:hypothetical protein